MAKSTIDGVDAVTTWTHIFFAGENTPAAVKVQRDERDCRTREREIIDGPETPVDLKKFTLAQLISNLCLLKYAIFVSLCVCIWLTVHIGLCNGRK